MLIFYSGSKGFHLGIPLWFRPQPSTTFHLTSKRVAETIATKAGITLDPAIYNKSQPFRCPNSLHPITKLYKRLLSHDELRSDLDTIQGLATSPKPFECMPPSIQPQRLRNYGETEPAPIPPSEVETEGNLNRATLEFLRYGATEGNRA